MNTREQIDKLTQELKSSEEKTRLIMANIPVGLIVLRGDGKIEAANSKIEEMFHHKRSRLAQQPVSIIFPALPEEFPSLEAVTGLAGIQRVPGKTNQQVSNAQEIIKEEKKNAQGKTLTDQSSTQILFGLKADGQRFPCEVTEVEVDTPQSRRRFMFITDITERHELEELKRDFIAMVSHDLSTPLASVKLCLDTIGSGIYGDISGDGLVMVDQVKMNVERLISLINDLLCLDKLEAGELTIKRRQTRLNTILERSMNSIVGLSEPKNIEIKPFFHGGTGREDQVDKPVSIDEDRVVQVLVNLLSNAVKYSPEGSAIRLAAWTEGEYTCFTVADNGIGISDELKSSVFEKYKQLDVFGQEEQNRVKGFGLGLAICKSIVEQHHGRIWIENTPGSSGCTFQIRLPQLD